LAARQRDSSRTDYLLVFAGTFYFSALRSLDILISVEIAKRHLRGIGTPQDLAMAGVWLHRALESNNITLDAREEAASLLASL
jgi:TPR repeat protein